jgi:hypothetical protein
MNCEIIQFSAARPKRPKRKFIAAADTEPQEEEAQEGISANARTLSTTAKNGRLRQGRREVWRAAEAATRYWRARLDFEGAVSYAQRMETPEGRYHPKVNSEDHMPMVRQYREAFVKQLLTPAWDTASIAWKRSVLARNDYVIGRNIKKERLERAISEDLAFLAAHPVRRDNSEAMARRREFNEVMRRRIRDVAASRDLSDEEIKSALKLKHQEVWRFCQQHGVNFAWLLEGKGRIFEKDVVHTLPTADQRSLDARIREIVDRRLDETPPTVA